MSATFDIIATTVMWNLFFVNENLFRELKYTQPDFYDKVKYASFGVRFLTGLTTFLALRKYY